MRARLCVALLGLLGLSGATGCEAFWGDLAVPAPENCIVSTNMCSSDQVCNPVSQLCEAALVLSQVSPAHANTGAQTSLIITGKNFVPGMVVKWNGTALSTVNVDSSTQLQVLAPSSPDGSWRVTLELQLPSGISVSRSDLFSYSATNVAFESFVSVVPSSNGLSTMVTVPAPTLERATLVLSDSGSGILRGLTINDDGVSTTNLWTMAVSGTTTKMLAADTNGDGVRDLVIASNGGFYRLLGNPDLTFQPFQVLHGGFATDGTLGVGDVDHDGQLDVVGIDASMKQIAIVSADGSKFMELPEKGGLVPIKLAVAELDGQPGDDIAVTYLNVSDHFSLIPGGAMLGSSIDVNVEMCSMGDLIAGRFGKGPNQSLLLSCADHVQVFQNAGGGTFTLGLRWPFDPVTKRIISVPVLADFDGDGDLDVVVVLGPSSGAGLGELWWFENLDGNGTMMAYFLGALPKVAPTMITDTADMNNDGKPDLLLVDRNNGSTAQVTVLFNRSR